MILLLLFLFDLAVWVVLLASAPSSFREHRTSAATGDFTLYVGLEGLTD